MRIIELKRGATIELWPGRRVQVDQGDEFALFALPRTAMRYDVGGSTGTGSISFGSIDKTSVRIVASSALIKALAEGIVELERPSQEGYVKRFTETE